MTNVGWVLVALLQAEAGGAVEAPTSASFSSVGLFARVAGLAGRATDNGIDYQDLFSTGYGVTIDWRRTMRGPSSGFGYGASLFYDRFGGDSFTDAFGDTVTPDALEQVGGSVLGSFSVFFPEPMFKGGEILLQGFMGVGAVWSGSVDASFQIGGGSPVDAELFDDRFSVLADAGLRMGLTGERFAFLVTFRVRVAGGPSAGEAASGVVDPGVLTDYGLEVGWEYLF